MDKLSEKHRQLEEGLRALGSVAVAFSGGVDSTLLARVAHDALGDAAVALTAKSGTLAEDDLEAGKRFCREIGMQQVIVDVNELDLPGFRENPPDRCYICKTGVFGAILKAAAAGGLAWVAEGSNVDDLDDYRPGRRAIEELGVKSPLLEAGLTKDEVRELSRRLGLPTWNKPSAACLASRFAYGELITDEGLAMVAAGESFLRSEGFEQVRVRVHGKVARIEVEPDRVPELATEPLRSRIVHRFELLGFQYTTLDLAGYRMGSMNEALGL